MTNRFKKSLHRSPFDQGGFTLIELMIVVAVIGILAAIAFPSYQESVAKSRRADAQRALMEADQYMRRYFSAKDTFVGAKIEGAMAQAPREGGGSYTINLIEEGGAVVDAGDEATEATTYTLRATRTGNMGSDRCGDLSITNTGVKTQSNNASGTTLAECFKGS